MTRKRRRNLRKEYEYPFLATYDGSIYRFLDDCNIEEVFHKKDRGSPVRSNIHYSFDPLLLGEWVVTDERFWVRNEKLLASVYTKEELEVLKKGKRLPNGRSD